jgi:hypothetical protein
MKAKVCDNLTMFIIQDNHLHKAKLGNNQQ